MRRLAFPWPRTRDRLRPNEDGAETMTEDSAVIAAGETARDSGAGGSDKPFTAADYRRATLYSTLSPCDMCSGAILLYRIPRVVIGENSTFRGPEDYLRSRGVELRHAHSSECRKLMSDFIAASPTLWNEDIGET